LTSPGAAALDAAEGVPAALWTPEQRRFQGARELRFAGIVLVSIGASAVLGGILVGVDPCWRRQPSSAGDNQAGICIPIASYVGFPLLGAGGLAALIGAPLWVVGQGRMNDIRAAASSSGLSIGPGPVGTQGLSLRWRF
jgi:hypothetical protein